MLSSLGDALPASATAEMHSLDLLLPHCTSSVSLGFSAVALKAWGVYLPQAAELPPVLEQSSGMRWKRPRPPATQIREFCAEVPIWLC